MAQDEEHDQESNAAPVEDGSGANWSTETMESEVFGTEDAEKYDDMYQELNISDEEAGSESFNVDDYSQEDINAESIIDTRHKGQLFKKIIVDNWRTGAHAATIGIRVKDRYRARSRQFTENMAVKGDVKFVKYKEPKKEKDQKVVKDEKYFKKLGEETLKYHEIIGVNQAFWDYKTKPKTPDTDPFLVQLAKKEEGVNPLKLAPLLSRLNLKLFTQLQDERTKEKESASGRWKATIEESTIVTLSLTFGEKEPRPFFFINIAGYDYRIAIFKTFTFIGERYSFTIADAETGRCSSYYIEGRRFTPGSDYNVFKAETHELIARLDQRALNIGGRVDIRFLYPWKYADIYMDPIFRQVMILFASSVEFLDDICIKYRRIYNALRKQEGFVKKFTALRLKHNAAEFAIDQNLNVDKNKDVLQNTTVKMKLLRDKYNQMVKECRVLKWVEVTRSELSLHYNPRRMRS